MICSYTSPRLLRQDLDQEAVVELVSLLLEQPGIKVFLPHHNQSPRHHDHHLWHQQEYDQGEHD